MRKAFVFGILFIATFSIHLIGQEPLEYSKVDTVEGVSKPDLFIRAQQWVSNTFVNPGDVVSAIDKEAGMILISGHIDFKMEEDLSGSAVVSGGINYKLQIFIKEGRYKFILKDFYHHGTSWNGASAIDYGLLLDSDIPNEPTRGGKDPVAWRLILKTSRMWVSYLSASLQEAITTPTELESEW